MSKYYMGLKLTPHKGNLFELSEDYTADDITVPKGFQTDGATIPKLFWQIVAPPFKPKYLPAAVIHDYLCNLELYELADKKFQEILFDIEVSYRTKAMVYAVRLFHWYKYNTKL